MKKLGIGLSVALCALTTTATAQVRSDVNFAFGGATTNTASALDAFAVQNPQLQPLLAGIRAQGLNVIGLSQELDFATATLNDVDCTSDVFWLYAGINNYIAGSQDPSEAPAQLAAALERLYAEVGARRFVVPNLPAIGDIPLFSTMPQEVRDGLTTLTVIHNQILAGAIAGFEAAHADAEVVTVDVFSIFQAHKLSGQFADVTRGCDTSIAPELLTVPGACDDFLYLDIVHPSSAAWAPVAQAAVDGLAGNDVDRIITLGDSFSDVGSMSDTFLRTLGFPFPAPPFSGGRFTEAENVIQQVEALLATPVRTTAFAQPFATTQTLNESAPGAVAGTVFVPKQLRGNGRSQDTVQIRFEDAAGKKLKCTYRRCRDDVYTFERCSQRGVEAGDRVSATKVDLSFNRRSAPVSVDWLYYR